MSQTQKWVNLGLLVGAVFVFLFFNQLVSTLWGVARLPLNEDWPVEPAQAISFVVAGGLSLWARRFDKANTFFNEVVTELSKVTWPQRKETVASAGVVAVLLAIAAALLFVIDSVWQFGIRALLSF